MDNVALFSDNQINKIANAFTEKWHSPINQIEESYKMAEKQLLIAGLSMMSYDPEAVYPEDNRCATTRMRNIIDNLMSEPKSEFLSVRTSEYLNAFLMWSPDTMRTAYTNLKAHLGESESSGTLEMMIRIFA